MASSVPTRNSYSRSHSHSAASASYNPSHRVTRRKSTTINAATSAAAITAAINITANGEVDGSRSRRSMSSKPALGSLNAASYPSPPSSLPQNPSADSCPAKGSSVGVGVGADVLAAADKLAKSRGRRASEGSALVKKKSGHGELKCETCGKGYKHSSCLTKHLLVPLRHKGTLSMLLTPRARSVGNTPRNGSTPPSCSYQNISKFSCSRPPRSSWPSTKTLLLLAKAAR